jgi:competence ComEA-like helix-hairpin-helix protein
MARGLASDAAARVDLNAAGRDELTLALPGIGPVLANRIIAFRQDQGRFSRPDDLARVPGIGPRLAQRLADFIVVDSSHEPAVSRSSLELPPMFESARVPGFEVAPQPDFDHIIEPEREVQPDPEPMSDSGVRVKVQPQASEPPPSDALESADEDALESAGEDAPESAGEDAPESAGEDAPESADAPESGDQEVSPEPADVRESADASESSDQDVPADLAPVDPPSDQATGEQPGPYEEFQSLRDALDASGPAVDADVPAPSPRDPDATLDLRAQAGEGDSQDDVPLPRFPLDSDPDGDEPPEPGATSTQSARSPDTTAEVDLVSYLAAVSITTEEAPQASFGPRANTIDPMSHPSCHVTFSSASAAVNDGSGAPPSEEVTRVALRFPRAAMFQRTLALSGGPPTMDLSVPPPVDDTEPPPLGEAGAAPESPLDAPGEAPSFAEESPADPLATLDSAAEESPPADEGEPVSVPGADLSDDLLAERDAPPADPDDHAPVEASWFQPGSNPPRAAASSATAELPSLFGPDDSQEVGAVSGSGPKIVVADDGQAARLPSIIISASVPPYVSPSQRPAPAVQEVAPAPAPVAPVAPAPAAPVAARDESKKAVIAPQAPARGPRKGLIMSALAVSALVAAVMGFWRNDHVMGVTAANVDRQVGELRTEEDATRQEVARQAAEVASTKAAVAAVVESQRKAEEKSEARAAALKQDINDLAERTRRAQARTDYRVFRAEEALKIIDWAQTAMAGARQGAHERRAPAPAASQPPP